MPEMLTPEELATQLHTTPASLAQLRYRGGGPAFVKFGKKVFYRLSDVEAYIDANVYTRTDQKVVA